MTRLKQLFSFLRYVAQTFYDDRCLRSSAALTYTTLLSLVPLSTVIFSVFAAFPMFDAFAAQLQNFVFENFVPTSSEAIQEHIQEFASKTSKLTAIGAGFLILSALLMMNTIEGAMNDIWHIKSERKAIPKFMVYWAMLTLGPILVGASLAVTSYLTSLPLFNETALIAGLKANLLALLPFFATTIACTLLYAIVPNTYVPLRSALTGAVVAAVLFELAKKGFALYVTAFPTYEMIYGALATIPVFLVWLYLSWMVVMLGAEISYCLYHTPGRNREAALSSGQMLLDDFKVVGLMWQAQQHDQLLGEEELGQHSLMETVEASSSLERLQNSGLLHQTIDGQWALSKDSSRLTLADLYKAQTNTLPEIDSTLCEQDPFAQALSQALSHSNRHLREALDIHLDLIYQNAMRQQSKTPQDTKTDEKPEPPKEPPERQRIEPTIEL
jgi:membrane protein